MKRDIVVFVTICLVTIITFNRAFSTFFTQDDFILINEFSQNSLITDIKNVFGSPKVTHWRPIHNFYFLIAGNLFDKSYPFYHFFTLFIHLGVVFLIYKIVKKISRNLKLAFAASLVYAIHPAHFVTLSWISGSATTIGFLFLLISFYFYLFKGRSIALLFFLLALLSSEAMLAGLGLFIVYRYLIEKKKLIDKFTLAILLVSAIFGTVKFLYLTPKSTYQAYQIKIWPEFFTNLKYYILRVAGLGEASGDLVVSLILLGFLLFCCFNIYKKVEDFKLIVFAGVIILIGLFPFVLISNLSAHYMNISVFGLALLISISLSKLRLTNTIAFLLIFLLLSFLNVRKTYQDHWVIKRSDLSKKYIHEIENANLPEGSTVVFNDNYISTSKEATIVLGAGKALDFWFKDKHYKVCFTWVENCSF